MKKLIIVISLGLVAAVTVSAQKNSKTSTEDMLISMEKQAWEAFIKKDTKFFQSFLTEDSLILGGTGFSNKAQAISEIANHPCEVKKYELSGFKVTMLDKTTALLTYKASQDATCGGQKQPDLMVASSIFVKRGGKWLGLFHQESPITLLQ